MGRHVNSRAPALVEARAKGLTRYLSARPCPRGHIGERMVASRACAACLAARNEARFASGAEQAAYYRDYRDRTPAKRENDRAYARAHYAKHGSLHPPGYMSGYTIRRYSTDPEFKLGRLLRSRLHSALKTRRKVGSFVKDLGCSVEFLRGYIEAQFTGAMSWANHGAVWELDHRRPIASFDITNRDEFLEAAHYTNLQPLLIADHAAKRVEDWKIIRDNRQ